MKAQLRRLHSPDAPDLAAFHPDRPDWRLLVQAMVGEVDCPIKLVIAPTVSLSDLYPRGSITADVLVIYRQGQDGALRPVEALLLNWRPEVGQP